MRVYIYTYTWVDNRRPSVPHAKNRPDTHEKAFQGLGFGQINSCLVQFEVSMQVRMVTGDNLQTAKAIAEECGICTEGGIAIEGKTFRAMTIEQQYDVIPSIDVKLKP